ncbi:transcription antitermination factor NusB [Pseudochelatococcus contaminans]|uniref:16S rRNA (Cytosine967-C5)-methyltransferase n=1 Tax=Pseudochelatococcus contaminans TaxID=1538103 RepID=A0A7W5Z2J3_9HYPH|nr:16S rRNA (cytosine967-C5)-methyltransferase [Pseudochelatococcus contaminans]
MQGNRPHGGARKDQASTGAAVRRSAPGRGRTPPVPRGLPPRRVAAFVLRDITDDGLTLDDALAHQFGEGEGAALDERDRALVRAIATAALRRLGTIHAALDARMPKGIPAKSGLLAEILIVGAAQVLLLDIPDRAAVDLAVHHARADRNAFPYAKLVNAVLRRIAEAREAILADTDVVDAPRWLFDRWQKTYGKTVARAIVEAQRREPGIDISVKSDPALWAERLNGMVLPTGSIRLTERTRIAELPGFDEGVWWVQDTAASLPALLIGAKPGERVLDLCAAPGGKTAQLAAAGATVTAVDRSPERLERLRDNLTRLSLTADVVASDARDFTGGPFDAVLLDAPCSATGTIRRHPDVAWTRGPQDITSLATLQSGLLDHAAALVAPGGRLVYSTCSLEPEEGEEQIAAFLARHADFARAPISATEVGGIEEALTPAGDLRTLPQYLPNDTARLAGLDGFFAARLVRKAV